MATANVPKESLDLLQQYRIDVKDVNKANTQYQRVLNTELVPPRNEEANAEVKTATIEAQEKLRVAWGDYCASVQTYLTKQVTDLVDRLKDDAPHLSDGNPKDQNPLAGSVSSMVSLQSNMSRVVSNFGSTTQVSEVALVQAYAEHLSDLCLLCEKWYSRNEKTFTLPCEEALASLAIRNISSTSRLLRLLGLRLILVCSGNVLFMRTFANHPTAMLWAGLFGDREIPQEMDALLALMERMLMWQDADPKAFPKIPFGWLYRLISFLNPTELLPSLSLKRRTQAIQVALHVCQTVPAQALAAKLHLSLLQVCLYKGGCTTDETKLIMSHILQLFEDPLTRRYMNVSDISLLFAPFLSTYTPITPDYLTTLNSAKDLLVLMMTSWVGSLWVACETTCLRSLIDILYLPGEVDRKYVVFTLFNNIIARLAPHRGIEVLPNWMGVEEDRRRKEAVAADEANVNNVSFDNSSLLANEVVLLDADDEGTSDDFIPTTKALGYYTLDPLLGRVLLFFIYHGLMQGLIASLQTLVKNRLALDMAATLIHDLFVLMDTVLPKETVSYLHETYMKAVGRLAADREGFVVRLSASLLYRVSVAPTIGETNNAAASIDPGAVAAIGATASTPQSATTCTAAGILDVDDAAFIATVAETKVESNRLKPTEWNFDLLLLLVQGPLRNVRRLRASMSTVKILTAFYTPQDTKQLFIMRTFSSLKPQEATAAMCALGVELLDLLLTTRVGAQVLDDCQFPARVAAMLSEVRIGKPTVLNKDRINTRLGQTLVRMTCRLSAYANGLYLMREYGLFEVIDRLFSKLTGDRVTEPAEDDTLHDVCYQLLQYLHLGSVPNHGVCEDIRQTFRFALTNPSNSIRLCATTQLKKAVWRDLSTSMKWGIETLVQILQDDFFSVVESAFKLLLNICLSSDDGLDYLISLFPTVLMESELILSHAKMLRLDVLLYRIASRSSGFRFLQSYRWIETELERWISSESRLYTNVLWRNQASDAPILNESTVRSPTSRRHLGHSRTFSDSSFQNSSRHGRDVLWMPATMGVDATSFLPVHFASVLCNSQEGAAFFKHSELWTRSVNLLLEQPLPPDIVLDDSSSSSSGESSDDSEGEEDVNRPFSAGGAGNGHRMTASLTGPPGGGGGTYDATGGIVSSMAASRSLATAGVSLGGGAGTAGAGLSSYMSLRDEDALLSASNQRPTNTAPVVKRGHEDEAGVALSAAERAKLRKGYLNVNDPALISACRGYKPASQAFTVDCKGDPMTLCDAIVTICQAATSDPGYTMVKSVPRLLDHINSLGRFASSLTVRSCALCADTFLARSAKARADLPKAGFYVLHNSNAYVSADGVPYAVSFVHMKPQKCMSLSRRTVPTNTVPRHAYQDNNISTMMNVPKRVSTQVFALANPVSREGAKTTLYAMMKRKPVIFRDPAVQLFCLEVGATYRMRPAERKFLSDLIDTAQMLQ